MDNFFFLILIRPREARQQILGSGSWSPFLDLIPAPSFNISFFWLPVCLYWNIIRAVVNPGTKTDDSPSKLDQTTRPEERKVRGWEESKNKKCWVLGTRIWLGQDLLGSFMKNESVFPFNYKWDNPSGGTVCINITLQRVIAISVWNTAKSPSRLLTLKLKT